MARTVQVLSSKGDRHYAVTIGDDGKAVSCDQECKGWFHNQKCRHLADGERLHREQEERDAKTGRQ
jgi:hypothetical protein